MRSCEEALKTPRPQNPPDIPTVLVAASALVDKENKVLLAKRPQGKEMAGLWEFPGGKVKEGETPEFALMRELEEELGIETRECCFSPIGFASHSYKTFHLLMPLFVCRVWKGEIQSREGQEFAWVRPQDMYDYPMPEADIPLIYQIRDHLI
ncbi:MAG: (deoxy)nucleoside triphosphate pyrophosphohydrolase [Alphaproteobacteria bacterium]|nr:(deoxy)nucleoside triphosphate pyrophosphohydrolase [Alphaproteobacteria bacterium]